MSALLAAVVSFSLLGCSTREEVNYWGWPQGAGELGRAAPSHLWLDVVSEEGYGYCGLADCERSVVYVEERGSVSQALLVARIDRQRREFEFTLERGLPPFPRWSTDGNTESFLRNDEGGWGGPRPSRVLPVLLRALLGADHGSTKVGSDGVVGAWFLGWRGRVIANSEPRQLKYELIDEDGDVYYVFIQSAVVVNGRQEPRVGCIYDAAIGEQAFFVCKGTD